MPSIDPDKLYSAYSDLEDPIREVVLMAKIADHLAEHLLTNLTGDESMDRERERLDFAIGKVVDAAEALKQHWREQHDAIVGRRAIRLV
jgi:hypothetical protein